MVAMSPSDELSADYAQAGFGKGLDLGRSPALIVIDMARAYFEADAPLYLGPDAAPATLASVQRVIAAARAAHVPIVFTEVRFQPGGRDGGIFFRKVGALACFEAGNPLGQFATGIEPLPGDVIVTKQYASAFFATSLASTLTALGVDTVLVTGVSTSGCVRATSVDACQHGFIPLVVRDACGDRSPAVHEANLFDLQQKYAEVRSEAEALLYLERSGVAHDQP
jgi:maleamate amidohydrolase